MQYADALDDITALVEKQSRNIVEEVVAYLHDNFSKYSWVGIYLVQNGELVLGPWRGPHATEHTNIPIGEGICGAAAASGRTEIIGDVASDKRYLVCFVTTKSEIVVPIKKSGVVLGEIDIDSDVPNAFDENDADFLEKVADLLCRVV
jgi:GAF domain-containing protein